MTAKIYKFPKGESLEELAAQYKPPTYVLLKDWDTGEWVKISIDDLKNGTTGHRTVFDLGK